MPGGLLGISFVACARPGGCDVCGAWVAEASGPEGSGCHVPSFVSHNASCLHHQPAGETGKRTAMLLQLSASAYLTASNLEGGTAWERMLRLFSPLRSEMPVSVLVFKAYACRSVLLWKGRTNTQTNKRKRSEVNELKPNNKTQSTHLAPPCHTPLLQHPTRHNRSRPHQPTLPLSTFKSCKQIKLCMSCSPVDTFVYFLCLFVSTSVRSGILCLTWALGGWMGRRRAQGP